ncbi:hypothetical protein BRYFOR_08170 [Marvinbryantia formatexigens DSM 14469]|uniref:Uncharacterized protein n=1 Tax=Marvinbryantia formatexigens DSM 14469 TaxID=478749 RepID=C6LHQ6_9FIRM|nr:hypothetical protein BRYFOR_08170 [Marvinbryantia formatexigens DSM 14469]
MHFKTVYAIMPAGKKIKRYSMQSDRRKSPGRLSGGFSIPFQWRLRP